MKNFDIKAYFENRLIDYHLEGERNVSRGWVNIQCPFPYCYDPSWHCGVNLESKFFNCYKCGEKGSVVKLVSKLEGCSWRKAKRIIHTFREDISNRLVFNPPDLYQSTNGSPPRNIFPEGATTDLPQIHRDYLSYRGFDSSIIKKYKLRACYTTGRYKYRLIIPIFLNNKIITFTSLDVTGRQSPKYKHQDLSSAVVAPKHTLYNIDSVTHEGNVAIVEGITDVWRIGDGAVCTFGTQYTKKQISLLIQKEIKNAFVLFDAEAEKQAQKLANILSGIVDKVILFYIDRDDPDKLNKDDLLSIRMRINQD